VAVEIAVKRRFEIAGFVALLYLYSVPFAFGFVNFEFALGLALWGVAGWIAVRDRSLAARLALHTVFVGVLVIGHLFALGIYGLTLGLYELHACWSRRDLPRLLRTYAVLAAPALIAFAVLVAIGDRGAGKPAVWMFGVKPLWLIGLNGYSMSLSVILASVLAVVIYVLARNRVMILQGAGAVLLGGYAATFLMMPFLMPFGVAGTAFADVRVVVAAAFVVPSFLTLHLRRQRDRLAVATVMTGLILANVGIVTIVQTDAQRSYREIIASFALLKDRPRIVVVARDGMTHPLLDLPHFPLVHAPTLAAHFANAFVPTLFTYVGQQPIAPREHVRHLAGTTGELDYASRLGDIARGAPTPHPGLANWRRDYDYVYVVGPPGENPLPEFLDELARGGFFTAYAIRRPPAQ
jgi:hypothetical protein